MRIAIIAVVLLCFAVSVFAAAVRVPVVAARAPIAKVSKIRQVGEVRQIKFAYQPVVVKSPGPNPPQKVMSGSVGGQSAGSAYKNGTGVVLRPAFLTDPATGSEGSIQMLYLTADALTKLQKKEIDIEAILSFADQAHSSASTFLFSGCFMSIPQGTHTYVYTCRFFGGEDVLTRLWFYAGDQQVGPDKQVVNPSTNEISFIFSYTPKDQYTDYVNVGAYLNPNSSDGTYSRMLRFWYMQLVQIN